MITIEGVDLAAEMNLISKEVEKKLKTGEIKQYQLDLYEGKITKEVLNEIKKIKKINKLL